MSRHSAFCSFLLAVAFGFAACNSSSEDELEYELPTSTLVKSFSLSADSKVLANLDKVFFSIDLNTANIFNADSLPYGTDVTKLVPVITTGGVSALEIIVKRPGESDTTYNYLTNSTDSINFANGPVTLRLRSIDENATMNYTVKVNVHQVKSDSLAWGNAAYSKLPTNLNNITIQRSVKFKGEAYCLTTDGSSYCMAVTDNPAFNKWETRSLTFDFVPDVESLRATTDALYILSRAGKLYKSTDKGLSWSDAGLECNWLIGAYGDDLLATVETDAGWDIISTSGKQWAADADFPIYGSSIPIEYTFSMSSNHQITIVGGRKADGTLSDKSWGFDGNNWACLSTSPLPVAVEEPVVFPYFVFSENDFFVATKSSIFVALGGMTDSGQNNKDVYISYNYGMTWIKASEEMQLPTDVPAMFGAQPLIFDKVYSRASEEITSWDCPFVYIFGGYGDNGVLSNTIWRAVINRLMFKPIQ